MDQYAEKAGKILEEVNKVILGKSAEVQEVLLTFLAGGHILIEDIPGVGKTTLAVAFSRALGLECRRVQFTPDVMPSDLTGFSVYRRDEERCVYQQGSLFCNLLLADEINRTSPKTQSALLEVMEEGKVSVEGVTREVPRPFLVIATENPFGSAGTQSLPEAQVDRFMVTMTLGYPDFESELAMARSIGESDRIGQIRPVIDRETFLEMQRQVSRIFIKEEVYRYILELVTATRNHHYLEHGASPRATIALVKMARAQAWLRGREYCIPDDVEQQFYYTVSHRIALSPAAYVEHVDKSQAVDEILKTVKKPPVGIRPE